MLFRSNDFNVTTTHLKDVVNRMPELHTAPGRQVSAMGRGEGRCRGTGRGRRDGRGGRDRRSDRTPNTHTFRPEKCPDQDAVDRVKPNIVHRHVTGDRIFVDDDT